MQPWSMINWSNAMVIDREPEYFSRWIKEEVYIRKEGQHFWIGTRAATNSLTPTTAFLTRHLPVVSRTGRTEYQLLLIKASDKGKKGKGVNLYSASSWTHLWSAQVWITQSLHCKAHHTCLYHVIHRRAPQLMNSYSTSRWRLLLIYRPNEDERLSWPCWLQRMVYPYKWLLISCRYGADPLKFAGQRLSHPTNQRELMEAKTPI